MKTLRSTATRLLVLLALIVGVPVAAQSTPATSTLPSTVGGVVTLYALDGLTSSMSLLDGGSGTAQQERQIKAAHLHLVFHAYARNSFTVGVQERGTIVDLGPDNVLKEQYGYRETVGGGQGFESLHLEDGRVVIRTADAKKFQPIREQERLAAEPAQDSTSLPVVPGHNYIIRAFDRDAGVITVKLRVLAHLPDQFVTFRWERLTP